MSSRARWGDAYPSSARIATPSSAWSATRKSDSAPFSRGGLPRLEDAIDRAASAGHQLSGDEAFKLYDTFGLPLDFIEDLGGERQVGVDRAAFERAMEGQREKARAKSAFEGQEGPGKFIFESISRSRA
jgi:alanyl-tRNA synthetase